MNVYSFFPSTSLLMIAHAWLICCNVQQFQMLKLLTGIYFIANNESAADTLDGRFIEISIIIFFFLLKAILKLNLGQLMQQTTYV